MPKTNSYKAGFLTGFFCALLSLLAIGGAWWVGATMGRKDTTEKRENMAEHDDMMRDELEFVRDSLTRHNSDLKIEIEMGTPMSAEEATKHLRKTAN